MSDLSRRDLIKMTGLAAAGMAAVAEVRPRPADAALAGPVVQLDPSADLPKAAGTRLVVLGGGTSGLTIAKYAKLENPKFDVVLVEKRDMYASCFSSNLWYADVIGLEFLADHSFLDAAKNNNYTYFNATAIGLDRAARKLYTSRGSIAYDYLVVAPGIDYDYSRIGVKDPETECSLRRNFPGGFTMSTEHVTIRRKVHAFEGGVFVQTVPSGNYRCLPAPYERACMIAAYFKKNNVKGKVVILDFNPDVTIKAKGFHAAFSELYPGIIEYKPSITISGVDPEKKVIKTEFESFPFDDAAIYPGVRAAALVEQFGLMDPASLQKEAHIDPYMYNVIGDERVYVTGDSRPMPYSKSGNTSNSEGKYVAKILSARAQGKDLQWTSPETLCFSMVSINPNEAISVDARYAFDKQKNSFEFADVKLFENRNAEMGRAALEWAKGLYRDMFE
ncbi:twin-arginine translocation signal domain-containing protein [bacterium]|nr:MAG: twin-arginine translocation signal domain-containing protein [bacterium]